MKFAIAVSMFTKIYNLFTFIVAHTHRYYHIKRSLFKKYFEMFLSFSKLY